MKENEYKCDECGGVFKKGWSDEDATAEMKRDFGDIPKEHRATVCEMCYNELMKGIFGVH